MFKKIILGASSIVLAFSLSACGTEVDSTQEEDIKLEDEINNESDIFTLEEQFAFTESINNSVDYLEIYLEIGRTESWKYTEIQNRALEASLISHETIVMLEEEKDSSARQREQALEYLIAFHRSLYEFHNKVAQADFKNNREYLLELEKTSELLERYATLYFNKIK